MSIVFCRGHDVLFIEDKLRLGYRNTTQGGGGGGEGGGRMSNNKLSPHKMAGNLRKASLLKKTQADATKKINKRLIF